MENLKKSKSIRYQLMESKGFLLGFWGVLILVDIAFYIMNNFSSHHTSIGFSVGMGEGPNAISVVGVNLMVILITLIVYNYERNYESFPLAISLSMTRKDYFLSFLVDNIFITFTLAAIQGLLLKIDPMIVEFVGRNPLYNFAYFNIQTDNIFYIIFILFIIFLGFTSFWNLVASINYKLGYKMWIVLIAANIILTSISFKIGFIDNIFNLIGNILNPRLGSFQILIILVAITIFYILNYLIVIRTDIKKKLK